MGVAEGYFAGVMGGANPGGMGGWAFILLDPQGGVLRQGQGVLTPSTKVTSTFVEYVAAGLALRAYKDSGLAGDIVMRGRSRTVIHQMSGQWRVQEGAYVEAHERVVRLIQRCKFEVRWEVVPRHGDDRAEVLAREALSGILAPRSA